MKITLYNGQSITIINEAQIIVTPSSLTLQGHFTESMVNTT